jgi:cysteine synthase A
MIPGHGAAVVPGLFYDGMVDESIFVTDMDCIKGCRTLVDREAILAGGSTGAILSAIKKIKDKIPSGSKCVMIMHDRGERYLDTIYSDQWVKEHFGEKSLDYSWDDKLVTADR